MSADKIIAEIRTAQSWRRAKLYDQLEKDFGAGFARKVREQVDADERKNEAQSSSRPVWR